MELNSTDILDLCAEDLIELGNVAPVILNFIVSIILKHLLKMPLMSPRTTNVASIAVELLPDL